MSDPTTPPNPAEPQKDKPSAPQPEPANELEQEQAPQSIPEPAASTQADSDQAPSAEAAADPASAASTVDKAGESEDVEATAVIPAASAPASNEPASAEETVVGGIQPVGEEQHGAVAAGSPAPRRRTGMIIGAIIAALIVIACAIGGWMLYQDMSEDRAHKVGKCIKKIDDDRAKPIDCDKDGAYKIFKRYNDTTDERKCSTRDTELVFINETDDYVLCLKKV